MKEAPQPWIIRQLGEEKYKKVTKARERQLFAAYRAGDTKAQDALICANTRFVVQVALKYTGRGLELEDLIAEGMMGMQRALPRFNPATGHKFISYAVWWVRQAILAALAEQGRSVKIPLGLVEEFRKLKNAQRRLLATLSRPPTPEELADMAKVKVLSAHQFCAFQAGDVSLDTAPSEDQDAMPIPDPSPGPDATIEHAHRRRQCLRLLEGLKPAERDVLWHYFGLASGNIEPTMEEIGDRMELTRERVRQLKESGLKRARGHARRMQMQTY